MPQHNQDTFERELRQVLEDVATLLLDKNRKYGDAALSPIRVFSKSSPLEQLRVRMDDKLSRIVNQQADEDEDVYRDLLGYLVIYEIAKRRSK